VALLLVLACAAIPAAQQKSNAAWPPRTPDGQPDIQGIWGSYDSGIYSLNIEPAAHLRSIGMPRGTGGTVSFDGGYAIPKNPKPTLVIDPPSGILPHQPWALERRNSVMREYIRPKPWQIDPQTRGWPNGIPRMHIYSSLDGSIGGPWQVIQGPGYVLFLYELQHEFRNVPLTHSTPGGRSGQAAPACPGKDVKLWLGCSRGRWEGNTLIVESTNHNDSTRFDVVGNFHSDEMRVTERYIYVDKDTLEYRATVDDPKVYTAPWTISITNKRTAPGMELMEYSGVEGDKDAGNAADYGRKPGTADAK
jgi:hypothetical protein